MKKTTLFISTLMFFLLTLATRSNAEERASVIIERPKIDTQGEVFKNDYQTIELETGASISVPAGASQGLLVDELDKEDPEAQGVILELNEPPSIKVANNARQQGFNAMAAAEQGLSQRLKVQQEQNEVRANIEKIMKRSLVNHREKAEAGKIRTHLLTDVYNGIALLDISVAEAKKTLSNIPGVKKVWPNTIVKAALYESVAQIGADKLWEYTASNGTALTGQGVRVGILDTGVDYRHPDLGGCFGPGCKVQGGYDFINGDADPMDDHGHGTHVAATAAGDGTALRSDGSTSLLPGVAPQATIYAYKVLSSAGSGGSNVIIAAIKACADPNGDGNTEDHLDVCSMSLGGSGNPDDPMSVAVDNATASGVVFTIAAGNSGPSANTIGSPGTSRSAITVAASCKPSQIGANSRCPSPIASFSSRGPVSWVASTGSTMTLAKPDIAAPGVLICAAEWGVYQAASRCLDASHIAISGTSMATPHMAGAAALIRQAHPELTPEQVKTVLMSSAKSLGLDQYSQGAGQVDLMSALEAIGIPSSVGRISGLPISISDSPTTLTTSFSRTVTITNITQSRLTYIPSFSSDKMGLSASFDKTQLALAPSESSTLTISLLVDHSLLPSPSTANGRVTLATTGGELSFSISIGIKNRSSLNLSKLDFGNSYADLPSFSSDRTASLTNLMTDAWGTYAVSFDPVTRSGSSTAVSGITLSADQASISLAPRATSSISLHLAIPSNAALANVRYYSALHLKSSLDTIVIPITFAKGYPMHIDFGSTAPSTAALFKAGTQYASYLSGSVGIVDLLLTERGRYLFEALRSSPTSIVVQEAETSESIPTVSLRREDAVNTVTLNPIGVNGVGLNSTRSSLYYSMSFDERATDGNILYTSLYHRFISGEKINISNLPSGVNLNMAAANADPVTNILYSFLYRLNGPHTGNKTFTNSPSDLLLSEVSGHPNQQPLGVGNTLWLNSQPCPSSGTCNLKSSCGLPFGAGKTIKHAMFSSGISDLGLTSTKALPITQLYLAYPEQASGGDSILNALLFSQRLAFEGSSVISFTGINPRSEAVLSSPPSRFSSVGASPLFDSSEWNNVSNSQFTLNASLGTEQLFHSYGDMTNGWYALISQRGIEVLPTYNVFRDGTLIESGIAPRLSSPKLPLTLKTPGTYAVELETAATANGVPVKAKSRSSFKVLDSVQYNSNRIDQNPPSLRSVHLKANGIWQTVIDEGITNELLFKIDPVPGKWGDNTLMPDLVSSVSVELSKDGAPFTQLPLVSLGGGSFSCTVPSSAGVILYTFRITAKDLASNSHISSFEIPAGRAVQISNPGVDTVAPRTQIISHTDGAILKGETLIRAYADDNQSITKVAFLLDGKLIEETGVDPYSILWNSKGVSDGAHTLSVKAVDSSGNSTLSPTVAITVQNGTSIATPTSTPTRTATRTATSTPTRVATSTMTATPTRTITRTATATSTKGSTPTSTQTPTKTPTPTVTRTATNTPTRTATPTATTTPTSTRTRLATVTPKATGTFVPTFPPTEIPEEDTTPPEVLITNPFDGATIAAGTSIQLLATASDNVAVRKVEFRVNGTIVCADTLAPYMCTWKAPKRRNRIYRIEATAYDAAGNSGQSQTAAITIGKTTSPGVVSTVEAPKISIINMADGSSTLLPGAMMKVNAKATDLSKISKLELRINGRLLCASKYRNRLSCKWSVPFTDLKTYTIEAAATDLQGNLSPSRTLRVIAKLPKNEEEEDAVQGQ